MELTRNKIDVGVYIGRFSPFHKAHETVVRDALEKCEILIICCGSHSVQRTQKDPWITMERNAMIESCFTENELNKIKFYPLINYGDMEKWMADIMLCVNNFKKESDTLGIFGCAKDQSSWYLNEFPEQFKQMFLTKSLYDNLSSTEIRKKYFIEKTIDEISLPPTVSDYLKNYVPNFNYGDLPSV